MGGGCGKGVVGLLGNRQEWLLLFGADEVVVVVVIVVGCC